MENQWFPFKIEPKDVSHLNFPLEFLFVFVLRDLTHTYKVELSDVAFVSKTFSSISRSLENGEDYVDSFISVWISTVLKDLEPCKMDGLSDKEVFTQMSKRYYQAQAKSFNDINAIQRMSGQSIVKVFQELSVLLEIKGEEVRTTMSIPVGFCLYKTRFNSRGF